MGFAKRRSAGLGQRPTNPVPTTIFNFQTTDIGRFFVPDTKSVSGNRMRTERFDEASNASEEGIREAIRFVKSTSSGGPLSATYSVAKGRETLEDTSSITRLPPQKCPISPQNASQQASSCS